MSKVSRVFYSWGGPQLEGTGTGTRERAGAAAGAGARAGAVFKPQLMIDITIWS